MFFPFGQLTLPFDDLDLAVPVEKKATITNGMSCKKCREFNEYAEPNQDDKTFKCYKCRNNL